MMRRSRAGTALLAAALLLAVGQPARHRTPITHATAAPGAASIGDPYYPALGNGGYAVQHYTLDLTIDVPHDTLAGTIAGSAPTTYTYDASDIINSIAVTSTQPKG